MSIHMMGDGIAYLTIPVPMASLGTARGILWTRVAPLADVHADSGCIAPRTSSVEGHLP